MSSLLFHNWWAVALRGVAAILFGFLCFVSPRISLLTLVYLFGAYALADGFFNVVASIRVAKGYPRWWVMLLEGLVSIAAGLVAFWTPGITALVLLYVIAFWAVVAGVLSVASAVRLRTLIQGEWMLALSGALHIALGVLLIAFPSTGALAMVIWIGAYAVAAGVVLIALGFRMRSWEHEGRGEWPGPRVQTPA